MKILHIYIKYLFGLGCLIFLASDLHSQSCLPTMAETELVGGKVIFSYGSTTNARSSKRKCNILIGQHVIGASIEDKYDVNFGYYSTLLLPPQAPTVRATQGELLDRIQVSWEMDPLGPLATDGFNIYKDGVFLSNVGPKISNFNDYNVIAGIPYSYEVRALNEYGEGSSGKALGFQVPNGIVTGYVETLNKTPVPGALVTLTPMQGFSSYYENNDGGIAATSDTIKYHPALGDWSTSFWMKTDSAFNNGSILKLGNNFNVRAINSSTNDEGVNITFGGQIFNYIFPDSTKNDWHHITLTFEEAGHVGRLYVDGNLIDQKMVGNTIGSVDTLYTGNLADFLGWNGYLDELRLYHILLNELDLPDVMNGTASSNTDGLAYYWKMDEELGTKSYDIVRRNQFYFCGAAFNTDRPPVHTSARTDDEGYYIIEGVSYGTGTTFIAEPSKDFYLHKALKFVRAESNYATLPDFTLSPKATIELWANSASVTGTQTLISKIWNGNGLKIQLVQNGLQNDIVFKVNASAQNFGVLGNGYQHLAFTIDSVSGLVKGYKNGNAIGTFTMPGIQDAPDSLNLWRLGGVTGEYFEGLIDEIAVYDTTLTQASIASHFSATRNMTENGLYVYFPLDEGNGDIISNIGSLLLDAGNIVGPEWSGFAPNQMTNPHEFSPKTRQVTLNPSVTSVDQVDFTDRSTISVSGYVRFQNTDCFQPSVEILVNGQSFIPQIFTNEEGKFDISFDPGSTAILSPKYSDHTFTPAFWKVTNVTSPIAGLLFNNNVSRKVEGQVAGGDCKQSIIKDPGLPTGTVCTVKLRTADGCFEKIQTINNVGTGLDDGTFEFSELPPFENLIVSVTEHSNPLIKTAFQVQGGSTVDISLKDTIIDFIYHSQPQIEIVSGLETYSPTCNVIVKDQGEFVTVGIKLKEPYLEGNSCYIDSANFHIINEIAGEIKDTVSSNGELNYLFLVGDPNPSAPHTKSLQIVASTLEGNDTDFSTSIIITGSRAKSPTFTSTLPAQPMCILRDPPGDGSYAFLEKNTTICNKLSIVGDSSLERGTMLVVDGAPDYEFTTFVGLPEVILVSNVGEEATATWKRRKVNENTSEYCMTTNKRISTSDGDLVVGTHGGDVFMGIATNLQYGYVDIIMFDTTVCEGVDSLALMIDGGTWESSFIYSEYYIRNFLLYQLNDLLTLSTNAADSMRYQADIDSWTQMLVNNDNYKRNANFIENISYAAGAEYEYSITYDSTYFNYTSYDTTQYINSETTADIFIGGVGGGVHALATWEYVTESSSDATGQNSITTGYVLKDDDELDAFSVDIKMDSIYKTPVFSVRAGHSSCPWEPGTAKREGVFLESVDGPFRTDVPANEPATYHFIMHNTSATNETWTYAFTAGPESNPHSAKIFCNGAPMNQIQWYAIPWGTNIPVTVTLERGPVEYDYDDLEIVLYSACEDQRANDLGILPDTAVDLYSAVYISAHFLRPCSEVNINVPEQNFVVFPDPLTVGSDDIRRVTVSGYNTDEENFQLIRVQYRRENGDGAWINIPGTSDLYNPNWSGYDALPNPKPDTLTELFSQFFWNTVGLSDGPYELRAVSVCTGDASDRPGYSETIKGKIDREPPKLIGVPQPTDGVFNVGDEISFTFNQHINCNKLIQADIFNSNNVGLYDSETSLLIDSDISCFENKIVIDPNFQNEFFENKILRAELHNIEDLTGNKNVSEEWEFYVDRNELAWLTDSIILTKYEDETKSITAKIQNRGGYPVSYTLQSLPSWIHAYPVTGTLTPNEIDNITFTMDNNVLLGEYNDSIILHTETGLNPFFMGGDEILNLDVRVICRPPVWVIDPESFDNSAFNFSMNLIVKLNIEGVFTVDEEDLVGAYVDGQLRGVARVQYKQGIGYLAFLTAYSNQVSGETLTFQIWDASECELYANIMESFPYNDNSIIGTLGSPQVLHTNGDLLRKIYLHPGWNWLSMNLDLTDAAINPALASLTNPTGSTIKTQGTFSQYSTNLQQWVGNLLTVSPLKMYQYKGTLDDSISMVGTHLPAQAIPINVGWNWIGYLPNVRIDVNTALGSLTPSNGDLIKSQLEFAVYDATLGWVGSLTHMSAPNGYLLKSATNGSLLYPNDGSFRQKNDGVSFNNFDNFDDRTKTLIDAVTPDQLPYSYWQVNPTQFEFNMNAIALVEKSEGENVLKAGDEVAVIVNGEVRGSSEAIFIPSMNSYLIFLTAYANQEGELMNIKYYNKKDDKIYDIKESFIFKSNSIVGMVDSPEILHLLLTDVKNITEDDKHFSVYPNPFSNQVIAQYHSPKAENVILTIKDILGNVIEKREVKVKTGSNFIDWKPKSNTIYGTYFLNIETSEVTFTKKVLYLR